MPQYFAACRCRTTSVPSVPCCCCVLGLCCHTPGSETGMGYACSPPPPLVSNGVSVIVFQPPGDIHFVLSPGVNMHGVICFPHVHVHCVDSPQWEFPPCLVNLTTVHLFPVTPRAALRLLGFRAPDGVQTTCAPSSHVPVTAWTAFTLRVLGLDYFTTFTMSRTPCAAFLTSEITFGGSPRPLMKTGHDDENT